MQYLASWFLARHNNMLLRNHCSPSQEMSREDFISGFWYKCSAVCFLCHLTPSYPRSCIDPSPFPCTADSSLTCRPATWTPPPLGQQATEKWPWHLPGRHRPRFSHLLFHKGGVRCYHCSRKQIPPERFRRKAWPSACSSSWEPSPPCVGEDRTKHLKNKLFRHRWRQNHGCKDRRPHSSSFSSNFCTFLNLTFQPFITGLAFSETLVRALGI